MIVHSSPFVKCFTNKIVILFLLALYSICVFALVKEQILL